MNIYNEAKIELEEFYLKEQKEDGDYSEPSRRLWYFNNLKKLLEILEQFNDSPLTSEDDRQQFAEKIKATQIRIDEYKLYPLTMSQNY